MCTLSWLPRPDGHTFWHGRDERTTRLPGGSRLETRTVTAPGLLLTSSGAGRRVEEIRVREYARLAPGLPPRVEDIEALHRSHLESLGPDSFCMHREEAETASLPAAPRASLR